MRKRLKISKPNTFKFENQKLNIKIPKSLEIVWGMLKPKKITGHIAKIIVCCFYSPPQRKKNSKLVDHMTETINELYQVHPSAGIIIAGNRNGMEMADLVSIDPSLKQVVKLPTRGQNILDVVMSL